jgi:hypothetical protein
MVADIEAGKIDVIVYAERSRTNRTLDGYVELRQLCLRTGVLWCYDGRLFDLSKAADRRETARDAAEAEGEADSITDRNNRTVRQSAKRGWMHGPPALGFKRLYDPDTGHLISQEPHPDEAPVVAELFDSVDARESLKSLLPLLRPFRPNMADAGLRAVLQNRSYIGIRVHHDQEYPAAWPALVTEDVFWRVQAILSEPERRTTRTSGVQHLQTGIALCAVCRAAGQFDEARMTARLGQVKHRRGSQYRCRINHMTMMERNLDAVVTEALLTYLGSQAARSALRPVASDGELEREQARVQAMTAQLEEARQLAQQFDPVTTLPRLSVASLAGLESALLPVLQQAGNRVRELLSAGDPLIDRLLNLGADDLEDAWEDELTLAQKRHVVRRVVRVEVRPAPRMGRHLDHAARVGLIFPGQPGFAEWPRPV